jgi:hypothetical protein
LHLRHTSGRPPDHAAIRPPIVNPLPGRAATRSIATAETRSPQARSLAVTEQVGVMNNIVYIVGAVVIVLAILGFLGFR